MRKPVAILGLLIGLATLILQFAISIPASMEAGRSFVLSVVFYFSFFTILTNIALVLIYAAALFATARWLKLFRTPLARATAAAAITLVMSFYHFVLAGLWQPQGLFWVADTSLHYITPILYLFWFTAWNRSGTLRFSQIPLMLAGPFLYLAYVLVRGAILGEYPYPVLDAQTLGYVQVGYRVAGLLVLLAILNAGAILIDRMAPDSETGT